MRATLSSVVTGALLAVAVVAVIGVSSAMDLEIESYALAGVLAGGIVALIPERSSLARFGALAIGLVAGWLGFILRAALLPDSEAGRSVAALISVAICLLAVAISRTRLPLVAMLVGVVVLSAAYEAAYQVAPAEVATTSLDAATAVLVTLVVGFAVGVLSTGRRDAAVVAPATAPETKTVTMTKAEVTR